MRLKMLCVFMALCLLFLFVPTAAAVDPLPGTVVFAQRYADLTELSLSGIHIGTSGGTPKLRVDGNLTIEVIDDAKAYLLLPDVPNGGAFCDTYTVEFTFRFTDIAASNGYFGFLMTGRGDGPSNRTEVILRASGSCDGVGALQEPIAQAMASGETVSVSVLVDHGMMYEIRVRAGGVSQSLVLPAVKSIDQGRRGFVVRNASVAVESVAVVSGIDYARTFGTYAESSYWVEPQKEPAPDTADGCLTASALLVAAGAGCFCCRRRRRV